MPIMWLAIFHDDPHLAEANDGKANFTFDVGFPGVSISL